MLTVQNFLLMSIICQKKYGIIFWEQILLITRSAKYGIIFCEQMSWITRSTKWVRRAKCTWSCFNINHTYLGPCQHWWVLIMNKHQVNGKACLLSGHLRGLVFPNSRTATRENCGNWERNFVHLFLQSYSFCVNFWIVCLETRQIGPFFQIDRPLWFGKAAPQEEDIRPNTGNLR